LHHRTEKIHEQEACKDMPELMSPSAWITAWSRSLLQLLLEDDITNSDGGLTETKRLLQQAVNDTEDASDTVNVGEHFRDWIASWYPYDPQYLPIILVSLGFMVVLLMFTSESFRCHMDLSTHPNSNSKGDETRSLFYDWMTMALLTRLVCMSWEAAISYKGEEFVVCLNTPVCSMARSLPDVIFASAYTALVLFYAYLAGKASAEGPRGISLVLSDDAHFAWFTAGNILVYSAYFMLLVCAYMEWIPLLTFQLFTYSLLFALYGSLLFILAYFGPVLATLLSPVMLKVAGRGLSTRLVFMCVVCILVLLSRFLCFGLAIVHQDARYTHGLLPYYLIPPPPKNDEEDLLKIKMDDDLDDNVLPRDLLGYTLLELLPSLAILIMMHQGRHSPYRRTPVNSIHPQPQQEQGPIENDEVRPLLPSSDQCQEHYGTATS
jgi:hypothetical protein